jgi:pimeloyl-[acyl-carrier protein] synthase
MNTETGAPAFDLLSESFFADPHPTLARLRNEAPVYFFEPLQSFLVTRYADIDVAARNPSLSSRRSRELMASLGMLGDDAASQKMAEVWSRVVFFQDPPRHTQLRQLIMKGFSPSVLEAVRPRVAAVVARALEQVRQGDEVDLVTRFAEPIAINSIAELFALPEADRPQFMKWSTDVLKPAGAAVGADEIKRMVKQSSNDMFDYMTRLVAERRKNPGDDIASCFIREADSDPQLAGEAAYQCYQMVGAGFVTSMNQILNTIISLLEHPDALAKLRAEPGRLKPALEEALRHNPAVLSTSRLCASDTEIQGTAIPKGHFVWFMFAAANRDPTLFQDPDTFDITRAPNRHTTFGLGSHYCPGAALIRLELEEGLRALLTLPK